MTTGAQAAITLSKSASPNSVSVGTPTTITYTLQINNTSTFADEVVVTDDLPVGMTFNAMIDFRLNGVTQVPGPAPTISGNRLIWDNGGAGHQIYAGQNLRIRFSGIMTAPDQGRYSSEVTATDLTGAPDDPPNDAAITTLNLAPITAGAIPTLTNALARAPSGTIGLNNPVTFTDTITNTGTAAANNLRLVVFMAPGWTYDAGFTPTWGGVPIGAPAINGQTLTFTGLGNINGGDPAKPLVYRLRAPGTAGTDGHSTRVYADNANAVNSSTLNITVGSATGVSVVQSFISNTNPVPGEAVGFEVTVFNAGPAAATVTEIRHDLQAAFVYDAGIGTQYSLNGSPFAAFQHPDNYASNAATLIWTNTGGGGLPITLNPGNSLVLRFTRNAPTNLTGTWASRGRADGSNFTLVTGAATNITIDGPAFSATLETVTSPPTISVLPGPMQYRITITNVGTGAGYAVPTWLGPVSPTPVWPHVDDAVSTVAQINGGPADTTNPTVSGRNLIWKQGVGYLLNPGDVLTVDFKVNVAAGTVPGQYPTRVQVVDAVYTANATLTTGDLAPVTVIAMPTVDLNMTVSPSLVAKPATVTYSITVRNNSNSPGPVTALTVTRTNPNPGSAWAHVNGSTVVTWSRPQTPPNAAQAGNGASYNISSWLQTYGGGAAQNRLFPGEWVTITYQYQINSNSPSGTFTSSALASGSNIVDVNTGPTAPVTVDQAATASLTKTVSPATVPGGGGVVSYTMTAQNTGGVNLTGCQWFDDLPAGFNYVPGSSERSFDGVSWTPIADPTFISGNTWRWTTSVATLNTTGPTGPTMMIRFQAVTAAAAGTYDNVVRFAATQLTQITTGPTASVTVGSPPVLSLNLGVSPASIPAGGPGRATYTVTLQNTGGTTAQAVTLQAVLPGYLGYVTGTSDMTIAATAPDPVVTTQLTWNNLGDIPPGETMTFSWQVIADSSAPPGTYFMEVSASGSNFGAVSTGGPPSASAGIPPLTVTSAASVVLTAFNAEAKPDGVQLSWRSGSEWQHLGYMVVRREVGADTEQALLDHLLGGPGNQVTTREYAWRDTGVVPGKTYDYWLEDVEIGGMTSRHGPLRITVPETGTQTASWTPPQVTADAPTLPLPAREIISAGQASRPLIDVVSADDTGITFDLKTLPLQALQQGDYTQVLISGLPTIQEEGQFELPMAVTAFGLPPKATYHVSVLERAEPVVLNNAAPPIVHFSGGGGGGTVAVPSPRPSAGAAVVPNVAAGQRSSGNGHAPVAMNRLAAVSAGGAVSKMAQANHFAFAFGVLADNEPFPAVAAEVEEALAFRDMDLVRLKLYPVQFDPATKTLTQYRRLRVRLTLDQAAHLQTATQAATTAFDEALNVLSADQGVLRRWTGDHAFDDGMPALPAGGLRLTVTSPGLHRVTAARLAAAGLDLTQPDRLQLFYRGQQVPLHVQMTGTTVEAITFHAAQAGNRYDGRGLYDLVVGDAAGQRMAETSLAPDGAAATAAVRRTAETAPHAYYVANTPAHENSDHWFADYLYRDHAESSLPVQLDQPVPAGQAARLQIDFASLNGSSTERHVNRVAVDLNGDLVGDAQWDGARYEQASFTVDAARLHPGANTVRVRLLGNDGAIVYVDRVALTYDGAWLADLSTPAPAAAESAFQASVPGADALTAVYRIDAAGVPAVGTGVDVAAGALRFGDTATAGTAYAVVTADDPAVSIGIRPQPAVNLRDTALQAEHLIIAPADLLSEAQRLATYRTSQGITSMAVPVESIYETFGGGHRDPAAIQAFLKWAVHNWQDPKPSYVLLFGDGHYDPMNWSGLATPTANPLPPLMSDTTMVGEVPNDSALVSLDGNKGLPSFFVGRLPVNTPAEAHAAVDKLMAYDTAQGPWLSQAIGSFDDNDPRFSQTLDRVADLMDDLSWSRFGVDAALGLKDRLRQGAGLTVYVGHGSDWGWADEDIFNGDDVDSFVANGQTGLMVAANCLNGYFSSPWYPGLGEVLVLKEQAGAVAFMGTSGFTLPANQERMLADLFRHLDAGRDLGMASTLAKLNLFLRGDPLWHDELSGWVLLGDPASKPHR